MIQSRFNKIVVGDNPLERGPRTSTAQDQLPNKTRKQGTFGI